MAHQMQSRRCIVYCDLHTDTLWKRNADTRLEQCLDFAEYTMHSSRVAVSGSHIIDWAVSCVIKDKAKQSHALQPHGDRYPSIHWWLSVVCVGFANRATNGVGPVSSRPIGGPICCLVQWPNGPVKKCMLVARLARRLKIAVGPAGQWPMSCPACGVWLCVCCRVLIHAVGLGSWSLVMAKAAFTGGVGMLALHLYLGLSIELNSYY